MPRYHYYTMGKIQNAIQNATTITPWEKSRMLPLLHHGNNPKCYHYYTMGNIENIQSQTRQQFLEIASFFHWFNFWIFALLSIFRALVDVFKADRMDSCRMLLPHMNQTKRVLVVPRIRRPNFGEILASLLILLYCYCPADIVWSDESTALQSLQYLSTRLFDPGMTLTL